MPITFVVVALFKKKKKKKDTREMYKNQFISNSIIQREDIIMCRIPTHVIIMSNKSE